MMSKALGASGHDVHAWCLCNRAQARKFTNWAEERLLTGVPEGSFVTHLAGGSEEAACRNQTSVVH